MLSVKGKRQQNTSWQKLKKNIIVPWESLGEENKAKCGILTEQR